MSNFFISYAKEDRAFASNLRDHIRMLDASNQVFIDIHSIRTGEKFATRILREIRTTDYFIVVLSKHSLKSKWVTKELVAARKAEANEGRRKLFAIRIDQCEIPPSLSNRHIPEFGNNFALGFFRLMHDILNPDSFFRVEHEAFFDEEEGYTFDIWIDEVENGFLELVSHVEYRLDHEFEEPVLISFSRRGGFKQKEVWTDTPIWVCVVIYLANTKQICLMHRVDF